MSSTPVQEPPGQGPPIQGPHVQGPMSDSGQTLPSKPLQHVSDASASKRVCFYKSGDYKFSGHRMVVNGRIFKTFDALLDALSKKVPLPFGVRTITTPRGTHLIKALDELHDGGAYVCSDQKRVKPLNLDEVTRRQVPWNTTRPLSVGQRARLGIRPGPFGQRSEATGRPAKMAERVAVRTPKRLTVIKNKDPTVKRTIVLQRRTAPTFDALLDYLSQILQFPVLRLYATDGRRVDGLATLILCSGVVVAAGNEPFRLGSFSFHMLGQMAQTSYMDAVEASAFQPRLQKNKPFSSGRGSRNFSLSSERYIINQINKCQSGSMNGGLNHHNESFETEVKHTSINSYGAGRMDSGRPACTVPQEDDIEKSFRINQDGSMTVEMKVHLTIKEEEMLHWTTTLSRSTVTKRTVCASVSESGNSSPDSNNALAKNSSSLSDGETKEDNFSAAARKGVGFNDEQLHEGYSSTALGKAKPSFSRTPTPGPRKVNKKTSVESVKMLTESGLQESTLGHYSYTERTADGEMTEGYCVVRHSSSSSCRPIPKPRKTASAERSSKHSNSSVRSAGKAEVLQIQNNGIEVTETVMHIYETQGCYDNYFANEEYSVDSVPIHGSTPAPGSKQSTDSRPHSLSNDCDIDCSWQPPPDDSLQRQKEEMLSLSSDPLPLTAEITNSLSANSHIQDVGEREHIPKHTKKKQTRSVRNHKSSTSTSSSDVLSRASKISPSKNSKHSSTEKLSSDASVRKKSLNSSESTKSGQLGKRGEKKLEKPQSQKSLQQEKILRKDSALSVGAANVQQTPKTQNMNKTFTRDNSPNVNAPSGRTPMKKNMSDILQAKKSTLLGKRTTSKPKSMSENRVSSLENPFQLSESISMPSLNPSSAEIHQYVENWLENVSPEPVPYAEEAFTDETQPQAPVVFQIGADSESEEKSESQSHLEVSQPPLSETMKKSMSCLSVPSYHDGPSSPRLHGEARGFQCVSMPSVRVDSEHTEGKLRLHKSAEAIGPEDDTVASSHRLSSHGTKAKLKPVLKQLCSSIQCIRRASDVSTSNLEKSSSVPDFPTQVASVFGSSCKAFLSFLSVMSLKDSLKDSSVPDANPPRTSSEAMLMMESLQKISAIEDQDEQRASLNDLRSRASSQFRERWRDFLILRERLESEPLSPKVSETEFALDVVSDGEEVFEDQHLQIGELMEELDMPQDLRAEITSTIQQTKSFYPAEESTFLETDRNLSDSEEGVEHFLKNCAADSQQSPETTTSIGQGMTETIHVDDDGTTDQFPGESNQEPGEPQEAQNIKESQEVEETEEDFRKYLDTTEGGKEEEDEEMEEAYVQNEEQHTDKESGEESVEKEEEVTGDEEQEEEDGKKDWVEEREGETGGSYHVEDTDEREGAEESEEEEEEEEHKGKNEQAGEAEEEEQEEEEEAAGETDEEKQEVMEEADEEEEVIEEVAEEEEEEEEEEEAAGETDEGKQEVMEEADEEEEVIEEVAEEEEEEEEEEEAAGETDEGKEVMEEADEEEEVIEEVAEEEEEEEEVTEEADEKQQVIEEADEEVIEELAEEEEEEEEEEGIVNGAEEDKEQDDEGQEQKEKGDGTDSLDDAGTDVGGGQRDERSNTSEHPVEISQELLDFINYALKSSSLIFTYDPQGSLRIEPDHARIVNTKQIVIPNSRKDSLYGSKCLPSPNTSDLSDYRPETSESGGYKTQESVDIVSDSGEEGSAKSPSNRTEETQEEQLKSNLLIPCQAEALDGTLKHGGSFSSSDSGNKTSKDNLSYCSAASSPRADAVTPSMSEKDSPEGVLIDQGRWLLKENHLIRKSPPVSEGMYQNLDSTSVDSNPADSMEASPHHCKVQQNPLLAISSSELEDMARPSTPKCTYYNMLHGSDSDPFLDDSSVKSGQKDPSSVKGRGFRVSPVVDTSRTWANKNGSLSSFASVEFKLPDGRVHPEGEASASAARPARTSSGGARTLQSQDSLEALHVKCGQYCPIL
ncbi:oxygen-regulated protein 1 [Salarias fasciatus]|uniref:oxygen-regulated protein 1 n=1 Tax=Salarias fasciatus TaxID=181472 RepID=UPI0011769501|nr:oxygen-regulated protein 1-like [Salarias fasciatus]